MVTDLLPLHLERMESSAAYFGFDFDRKAILAALEEESRQLPRGARFKVRVLLERSGALTLSHNSGGARGRAREK